MALSPVLAENALVHQWLSLQLTGLVISGEIPSFAASCFQLAREHAMAVQVLLDRPARGQFPGSAAALVRPTFEALVRGIELRRCGSDADVQAYIDDDKHILVGQRIERIRGVHAVQGALLADILKMARQGFNGYAHGGYHQVSRRLTSGEIRPSFSEGEMTNMSSMTTWFSLMAAAETFEMAGRGDEVADALLARIEQVQAQRPSVSERAASQTA